MKPKPTESCSKLGETGVSEAHVALLGFDLSKPELRQAFDIGRAKGAARMSECLYQIANGQRSEGSLAATKFFLLNACGWKDVETGPPPKWVPTVLDCMSALEREGVLDEIDREEKARASRAKADHVCPHCLQRPWDWETPAGAVSVPSATIPEVAVDDDWEEF